MTAITYIAKRAILLSGFSLSADVDISADTSDDSFNSVTSDLSGLLSGEWVLVANSASNNGWHQLTADSTATKITVSTNLTDEVAGANISILGYLHGINESYDLETGSQVLGQSTATKTNVSTSLSGVSETLLLNSIEYWDITTGIISEAELLYWKEFIASTRAREPFSFDAYGTIAAPDNVASCSIEGDPSIERVAKSLYYTITFRVRVA